MNRFREWETVRLAGEPADSETTWIMRVGANSMRGQVLAFDLGWCDPDDLEPTGYADPWPLFWFMAATFSGRRVYPSLSAPDGPPLAICPPDHP
jgi:hypothetical protein